MNAHEAPGPHLRRGGTDPVDDTHRWAVTDGYEFGSHADAIELAVHMAVTVGRRHGPAHAGVYLMAFVSVAGALAVEVRDQERQLFDVAMERARALGCAGTVYGAPWTAASVR